ncbi:MAG: hypothetical protein SGPRY_013610, partial [Prymnesium sp.]
FIDTRVGSSCELRLRFDVRERTILHAGAFNNGSLGHSSTRLAISPPRRRHKSSEVGDGPRRNVTCADSRGPLSSLPTIYDSLVSLSGVECSTFMLFSSVWFPAFLAGDARAACEATAEEWTAAATEFEHSTLQEQPAWSLPLSPRASMATLCPATCAKSGVYSDSCPTPLLPTPPSTPPALVVPHGSFKANTTDQLRAAVSAARLDASVTIELATGGVFLLDGKPLTVGQGNVTIRGEGEGAHIDAEKLSRIFEVPPEARLRVDRLTLSNGWTHFSGGAIMSSGALELVGCALLNSSGYAGGAISVLHGQLLMVGCEVFSCHAQMGGALFVSVKSSSVLRESYFINSTATNRGGAMLVLRGALTITDGSHIHDSRTPKFLSSVRLMLCLAAFFGMLSSSQTCRAERFLR